MASSNCSSSDHQQQDHHRPSELAQVAQMNNQAAALLANHRHKDALETFQSALQIMEERLVGPLRDTLPDPPDSSVVHSEHFAIDDTQITEIKDLKDDRFFIFNQAIMVKTAVDYSMASTSQAVLCFYTAVIIFNLALAYHKRFMTDPKAYGLAQSLRLYEHCLRVVRNVAHCSEDSKMLLHAASYNLAQIYWRKGDCSGAQQLLDALAAQGLDTMSTTTS